MIDRAGIKHLVPCEMDPGHEGEHQSRRTISLSGHDCSKNGCDNPELMERYT